MLRLIKLYSEDGYFLPIDFKPGINLIRGTNSKDDDGKITSRRQNGVGKSLSIELIDFCLLRTASESRIDNINEKYLPRDSFIYLHFKTAGGEYIIARNRKNEIKIKAHNGPFKPFSFGDAKSFVKLLVGLDGARVSLREYLNFFIKGENYNYMKFNELYKSKYVDLMKVHFYLFDLSLDTLKRIALAFASYDNAITRKRDVDNWLRENKLEIEQLKARRNELDEKIDGLERDLDYRNLVDGLQDRYNEIAVIEKDVNVLISQNSLLTIELHEIDEFIQDFDDDIYIDNDDIKIVFEKYKKGLGELVNTDLESLFEFRDQLSSFKSELMLTKREQLQATLLSNEEKIRTKSEKVNTFYKEINNDKKNAIVKTFRSYKTDILDTKEYDSYIQQYDRAKEDLNRANENFGTATAELAKIVAKLKRERDSFEKTFLDVHKRVTGSGSAAFDFSVSVKPNIAKKSEFFKFEVATETNGNKGANQMRAALYDAALHMNSYTSRRTIGFLVHDNLIFGAMDQESSIQFLNVMDGLNPDHFQYIATVNTDQFDYTELESRFSFTVKDKVAIDLTRERSLFHGIHPDFVK